MSSASSTNASALLNHLPDGPINVIKQRGWFVTISALLLIPGLVFMVLMTLSSPDHFPLKPGIDFTGGSLLDVGMDTKLTVKDTQEIRDLLSVVGYPGAVVQLKADTGLQQATSDTQQSSEQQAPAQQEKDQQSRKQQSNEQPAVAQADSSTAGIQSVVSIRTKPLSSHDYTELMKELNTRYGQTTLLQKNAVGPTLANELLTNGVMALVFAYVLIVGYLTFRFQFDYAACAILALLHDTLFVFGVFAALGYFMQVEVDSLFVTAILTVVGFSVHDTIVVFDRIRENERLFYSKKLPFTQLVNISVNQTLARSINTSLTALLPMFTLYFFGGETTKYFILALLLGVVVGTYSSICVASMALAWWREGRFQGKTSTTATA